ncbi:MAG TPA: hypothetical protein VNQ97_14835 [Burkholderiaceae bacterium]|nr:hypothetical protein [Burkholderiaceae bacterium]
MTPAERARQIDKEEFAAECAAIRQRVLANAEENRRQEQQRLFTLIGKVEASPSMVGLYTFEGVTLTVAQWAKLLGVSLPTLYARRRKLGTMEAAIALGGAQRPGPKPGVVSNLQAFQGTGAGSTAQETPNITFSQEAAE